MSVVAVQAAMLNAILNSVILKVLLVPPQLKFRLPHFT